MTGSRQTGGFIETIIDLLRDILKSRTFIQLLITCLMPNILVWGSVQIGTDNDHDFFWYYLIGPYWHLEVFVFNVIVYCLYVVGAVVAVGSVLYLATHFLSREKPQALESETPIFARPGWEEIQPKFLNSADLPPAKAVPETKMPEPEKVPLTPEEVRRRAIQDITGRGA